MRLFRCALGLVILIVGLTRTTDAQADKPFPTDEEITLVLNQTERAVQQYKPLIDQEEIQMGKGYAGAAANDRQVIEALETAIKAFKAKPQGFNGALGFAFFAWLDDADRNALLCSSGASLQSTRFMMEGNRDKAESLLHLAQSCQDASTLIYTVSENADLLYTKYVEAQEQVAIQGADVAQKCTDILKKNNISPQK